MSQIIVNDLTFAYDGSYDNIFENVSFQIETEWKLGFTGRNGRGKTTFLNLLMGKIEPNSGSIRSRVVFDYFPFVVSEQDRDTREVVLSIVPEAEEWELYREISLLGLSDEVMGRPFCTLSEGEKTKVLIAALFIKEGNFLLIDEPTNHLDMTGRKTMGEYLSRKQGFILVSHDRELLDIATDHTLSINKTNIEIQKGSYSSWKLNKDLQDEFEAGENVKLKKEIRRLNDAAARTANWSDAAERSKIGEHCADRGFVGHKAAKMMQRSKSTERRMSEAAEQKSALLKNVETSEDLKLSPINYHSAKVVDVQDLSIEYNGRTVCSGVTFDICSGERVALCGKNGSGKSSVLKLILGEKIDFSGTIHVGSNLKISYVSQTTAGLRGDLRTYAREFHIDESVFKAILRKMDFSRVQFDKDISEFSEGQKKKVLLARSLCESAHLYIWDEPLNYVDILSRVQIEQLILKYEPTMLFVEHDSAFIDAIGAKRINL